MNTTMARPATKRTLKTRIRETIMAVVHYREWAMEHGFGSNDMGRRTAITRIRRVVGYYATKGDMAHIRMVLQLKDDLQKIMPPEGSRMKRLRKRVTGLLDWCEETSKHYQ